MGANTKIEWTDHTFNPWIGCTKVSPGCANCYAETLMDTRYGRVEWGPGKPRSRTSLANWKQPLRWNRDASSAAELWAAGGGKKYHRPRVFCASLADWLDDEVPVEWLSDLLDLIRRTPHLDWLLLTKRPQNWRDRLRNTSPGPSPEYLGWLLNWLNGYEPENVWIGTTVEDQVSADQRIPELLKIPARVRFLSCEPLLGSLDLQYPESLFPGGPAYCCNGHECACQGQPIDPPLIYGISWVIAGGESGPGARPMHSDWARSLRDQCKSAGVPFFFKQWGEWAGGRVTDGPATVESVLINGKPAKRLHDFGDGAFSVWVGKKSAGRLLDGAEHNAFPEVWP